MSKSVKSWPSTPCRHLGPLEIMANVSYYKAKELYTQSLPTLDGIKKPEEDRDDSEGSKDFFYSLAWVRGPFVMLPLGVEFGFNGFRIGFVRTWRFYLTKKPALVESTCGYQFPEENNCAGFEELQAAAPNFLRDFYLEEDYFQAKMFYVVFAGKAKKK